MNALALSLRRTLLLLFLVVPLAACQLFSPAFDPNVGNPTTQAYEAAMQLVSEAEYGRFQDPATFADASQRYAAIDAQLAAARIRVEAGDGGSTSLSRRAQGLLAGQIQGCRTELQSLARTHARIGVAPNAGLTEQVVAACDMAARSANGMANE